MILHIFCNIVCWFVKGGSQWPDANAKNHTDFSLSSDLNAPPSNPTTPLHASLTKQGTSQLSLPLPPLSSPNSHPLSGESLFLLPSPCPSSFNTCSYMQSLSQCCSCFRRCCFIHSLPSGLQSLSRGSQAHFIQRVLLHRLQVVNCKRSHL